MCHVCARFFSFWWGRFHLYRLLFFCYRHLNLSEYHCCFKLLFDAKLQCVFVRVSECVPRFFAILFTFLRSFYPLCFIPVKHLNVLILTWTFRFTFLCGSFVHRGSRQADFNFIENPKKEYTHAHGSMCESNSLRTETGFGVEAS